MNAAVPRLLWLLCALWLVVAPAGAGHYVRQRVVYHINYDDPDRQLRALSNIGNHLRAVGPDNIDLRVVVHGEGVSLLRRPAEALHDSLDAAWGMRRMIDAYREASVRFLVGRASLRRRGLRPADLYGVRPEDVVDNGIAELVRLQRAGFTYLKP